MLHTFIFFALSLFFIDGSYGYVKRANVADVSKIRGGILVKSGTITSCEVVVSSNYYALVPANCIDVDANLDVKSPSTYEVYIQGGNGTQPYKSAIESFSVNHNYNSSSLANNIAVAFLDGQDKSKFQNLIGLDLNDYSQFTFARKTLLSKDIQGWDDSAAIVVQPSKSSACSAASSVYAANTDSMFCIDSAAVAKDDSSCAVPYGLSYGVAADGTTTVVAMYSHSAVYGDSMCGGRKMFHYYSLLTYYYQDASYMTNADLPRYISSNSTFHVISAGYRMNNSGAQEMGVKIIGGITLKAYDAVEAVDTEATESQASSTGLTSPTGTTATENPLNPTGTGQGDQARSNGQGISKVAIIALGVASPLVTIALVVLAIFWYKKWKKKQHDLSWDPDAEIRNLQDITLDIGVMAEDIIEPPPAYESPFHRIYSFDMESSFIK